jgi:hypothetical protein
MATDLLDVPSELLIGSTETLDRALRQPATKGLTPRDAKDLLRHSRYVLRRIAGVHSRSRKALTSGIEGSVFSQVCERMKEVIEHYLDLNRVLEGLIQRQTSSGRQRRRLASLKRIEGEATRMLQFFREWSMSFGRPPRPIDWSAVAEAEAAHARGEHRKATEFEADLEKRSGL